MTYRNTSKRENIKMESNKDLKEYVFHNLEQLKRLTIQILYSAIRKTRRNYNQKFI